MKNLKTLVILPIICLAACGKAPKYIGKYSFRMGKESEAHLGAEVELTNEDYVVGEKNYGKKFIAKLDAGDLSFDFDNLGLDLTEEEKQILKDLLADLNLEQKLKDGFDGFYKIGEKDFVDGKRLQFSKELLEDAAAGIELSPEIIENILVAYVNEKQLTLQLPVSINDLLHQLIWYGFYIDVKPTQVDSLLKFDFEVLPIDQLPGQKGEDRYGTHPSSEQVITMNNICAPYLSHTFGYIKHEDELSSVCKFYKNTNGELCAYFYDPAKCVEGLNNMFIEEKNAYGIYDVETAVKVTLAEKQVDEYDNAFAKVTSIEDGSDQPVDWDKYYQKAFTFRDFHDIKIGLTKETNKK